MEEDKEWWTFQAVREGNVACLACIIEDEPSIIQQTGGSLVVLASRSRSCECLRLLLSVGADVSWQDDVGRSALHWAAFQGLEVEVEMLLACGSDVNAPDGAGCSPLHLAACTPSDGCVALLLDRGAIVDLRNKRGWTPLHMAANSGEVDAARILLYRGACCWKFAIDLAHASKSSSLIGLACAKVERLLCNEPCRQSVYALFCIRRFRYCNGLSRLPREIVFVTAKMLWSTRKDPVWVKCLR